jgi:hypothetical protein
MHFLQRLSQFTKIVLALMNQSKGRQERMVHQNGVVAIGAG